MTLIYLISALTIRTQHTKQERTTSGQEGQDKRPRPSVWLGQAHRASASREQPFRGTSAIVVRSSFDGASVAGAYRAHIDHAARADSDHAQRSRDELILGLLVGHAEAVAADSRAAHSPSAWYARAIANAAPPASAQRTASLRRALERSNASPAQAAQGPGAQNRATWWAPPRHTYITPPLSPLPQLPALTPNPAPTGHTVFAWAPAVWTSNVTASVQCGVF